MLRQSLLISKNVLSNSNLKLAPTSFTHSIKSFHSIRSISFQSTNKSTFSSSFISSSSSFSHSRFSTSSITSSSTSSTASTPNKPSKAGKKSSILTIGTLLLGTSISYYIYSNFLIENTNNQISNQHFIPLKVIKIETLTKDTKKFTLNLPDESIPKIEEVSNDPIRSVYIMQPDINVQRAYTVLNSDSFIKGNGKNELELIIKRYPDGEVSRWMHRLRLGDEVSIRGPAVTWFQRENYDEVIFIVGGTGITPAYQYLLHTLSSSTPTTPKIRIVYSSSTPSDILLKPELDALVSSNPDTVSLHYLASRTDDGSKSKTLEKGSGITLGRIAKKELESWIGRGSIVKESLKNIAEESVDNKKRIVLVSGPEGMVEYIAGPRSRNQSSGPVGGILKELGFSEKEVVKL